MPINPSELYSYSWRSENSPSISPECRQEEKPLFLRNAHHFRFLGTRGHTD